MDEETEVLKKKNMWEIVELPQGRKVAGCKWVYMLKYWANGIMERCKATLVAKGFTQSYRIDF